MQDGGYVPPQRKRRHGALSLAEREEISRGLARGDSLRQIGRLLRRPASTVSREIAKNKGRVHYRAVDADDRAWDRARRRKRSLLATNPPLRQFVAARLAEDWSPEQIAAGLDEQGRVDRLVTHPHPRSRRVRPGQAPGDLLGRGVTQIATVVERATRFTVLVQLDGRDMDTVTRGLAATMTRLPEQVRKSLTWDRGMELAGHEAVTTTTGLDVYFCDPRSPWQRGTNEKTNRLLRQYFPKGASMAGLSQDDLHLVALRLNTRPRKTLGFDTPADRLAALLR